MNFHNDFCNSVAGPASQVDRAKVNYRQFFSVDYLQDMMGFVDRVDEEVPNRACRHILDTRAAPVIIQRLKQLEFNEVRFIGAGSNAVVLQTTNNLAIRLRAPATENPATQVSPYTGLLIHPTFESIVNEIRMVFMPYVDTLKNRLNRGVINQEKAKEIIEMLRVAAVKQKPECFFWDWYRSFEYVHDQVGFLPDNTPIITDMGSIVGTKEWLKYFQDKTMYEAYRGEIDELRSREIPVVEVEGWDGSWLTSSGVSKTVLYAQQAAHAYNNSLKSLTHQRFPRY